MKNERTRVPLLPILMVQFIGTLGFSIVLPFLVFLVARWGGNALIYGVVGATYSAFQLVGAPVLGRLSDVHGRRRILLLSQVGTLVSWIILLAAFFLPVRDLLSVEAGPLGAFTLTLPLLVLFVARALDGLTGGNISVANAYLADVTDEEQRSASFGKMAVSSNLGFIVGPAIAGLLGATVWGEILPVSVAVAISLVAALVIAFRLPESNPCKQGRDHDRTTVRKVFGQESRDCFDRQRDMRLGIREILRIPGIPLLIGIHFLVLLGFNFFYIAFPMYAARSLLWNVGQVGIYFSVMSLLMVGVQGPVLTWATRHWSEQRLIFVGSLLLAISFVFFSSSDIATIYVGVVLLALGNGIMWPSIVSRLSKAAGSHQGTVQGFAGAAGAVASIVGLVVGGLLYDHLESRVFLLSATIILVVFGMSARISEGGAET